MARITRTTQAPRGRAVHQAVADDGSAWTIWTVPSPDPADAPTEGYRVWFSDILPLDTDLEGAVAEALAMVGRLRRTS